MYIYASLAVTYRERENGVWTWTPRHLLLYRVITYKLNTLLTRFFIESVDRFLKMISGFDKEDCEINIRHGTWVFVWREKTYNFEDFFVEKKNDFQFFFVKVCILPWNVEKVKKKIWPKKFPLKFWKILRNFFFKNSRYD